MNDQQHTPSDDPSTYQVADYFRAALNWYCYPAISPTRELWYESIRAGLLSPLHVVTIAILFQCGQLLGRHVSVETIKAGLGFGRGYFWGVVQPNSGVYLFSGYVDSLSVCTTPPKGIQTGRRPTYYALYPFLTQRDNLLHLAAPRILEDCFPPTSPLLAPIRAAFLEAVGFDQAEAERLTDLLLTKYEAVFSAQPELASQLAHARQELTLLAQRLESTTSTPLPAGWTYTNATEYVAAFARAIVEKNPDMKTLPLAFLGGLVFGILSRFSWVFVKESNALNALEKKRAAALSAEGHSIEAQKNNAQESSKNVHSSEQDTLRRGFGADRITFNDW